MKEVRPKANCVYVSLHQFKTIRNANNSERISTFQSRVMVQGKTGWPKKEFSRIKRQNLVAEHVPWMCKALSSIWAPKRTKAAKMTAQKHVVAVDLFITLILAMISGLYMNLKTLCFKVHAVNCIFNYDKI